MFPGGSQLDYRGELGARAHVQLKVRGPENVATAVSVVPCSGAEGRICPMTCQSSEAPESIESDRRADGSSGAVESEESRIALAMKELKNTGWYWGSLTANEAKEILQDASEGTFLVRDSSQRDYLFTISAVTSAGPTNLRIEYKHGKFKLDSVVVVKPKLKQFDSVVRLVEHYFLLSRVSVSQRNGAAAPHQTCVHCHAHAEAPQPHRHKQNHAAGPGSAPAQTTQNISPGLHLQRVAAAACSEPTARHEGWTQQSETEQVGGRTPQLNIHCLTKNTV